MHSKGSGGRLAYHGGVFEVDWGTVSPIGALVAVCFGYLARQLNRLDDKLSGRIDGLEDRLTARIDEVESRLSGRIDGVESRLSGRVDQLTERYIAHLERHPH